MSRISLSLVPFFLSALLAGCGGSDVTLSEIDDATLQGTSVGIYDARHASGIVTFEQDGVAALSATTSGGDSIPVVRMGSPFTVNGSSFAKNLGVKFCPAGQLCTKTGANFADASGSFSLSYPALNYPGDYPYWVYQYQNGNSFIAAQGVLRVE